MKKNLFLLSELIRRDLTARFAGSFGGPLWAFMNPLIFCTLYGFVFGVFLRVPVPAGFAGSYPEFLLTGLLPWLGFQEALMRGASSVSEQAHLVRKLRFPVELLVLSSVGAALILQAIGLSCLIGYSIISGRGVVHPLLLGAAFGFELVLLLGPAFALGTLNVFVRDLPQLLSPLLMILFYLTPILYPASFIPMPYSRVLGLNPLGLMAALFRAGLFGSAGPPPGPVLAWSVFFLVLGFGGFRFFRRCERSFADLL